MAKNTGKPKPAQRIYWIPRPVNNSKKPQESESSLRQRLNLDERNIKLLAFTLFIICIVAFATVMEEYLNPQSDQLCVDMCGDGICNEVNWQGSSQPCPESSYNCVQDCPDIGEFNEEAGKATGSGVLAEESIPIDEKARLVGLEYVPKLYCYRTYGGYNLVETELAKVSDENGGQYAAKYHFDVDPSLLPENMTGMTGADVELTISSNFVSSAKVHRIYEENSSSFCGYSTSQYCNSDLECIPGGCSGQVCQSISEEQLVTTCEWKSCYDASSFGLFCGCVDNQCIWH